MQREQSREIERDSFQVTSFTEPRLSVRPSLSGSALRVLSGDVLSDGLLCRLSRWKRTDKAGQPTQRERRIQRIVQSAFEQHERDRHRQRVGELGCRVIG